MSEKLVVQQTKADRVRENVVAAVGTASVIVGAGLGITTKIPGATEAIINEGSQLSNIVETANVLGVETWVVAVALIAIGSSLMMVKKENRDLVRRTVATIRNRIKKKSRYIFEQK